MAKVTNLKIAVQSGTTDAHYASWEFAETTTTTTSSNVSVGSYVSIKAGATYYNGVAIPDWVMNQKWQVVQITGDRAVLGKNESGTNNIQSPVNVANLVGSSGSSTTVTTDYLDHYEVVWHYFTGDGVWFSGGSSSTKEKNATYSAPTNATQVKVTVTPVSKTHTVNGTETSYWTGTAVSSVHYIATNPPEKPSTPEVMIEKYQLTASIENISDPRADEIAFEVYNGTKLVNGGTVSVITCRASFSCSVTAGGDYRVRCRAVNIQFGGAKSSGIGGTTVAAAAATILSKSGRVYSDWSDFSSSIKAVPSVPVGIVTCKATSETSVYLQWQIVDTATTYDIEYTTKINYFDGSDQTSVITGVEFNHYEKTGLETGEEYFFRVRAVNEQGESSWSEIKSVIIGKKPAAPTTWSSATTVITGSPLSLYWVHNAEDGSSQTYAELELYINGIKETYTVKNTEDEDGKDKTGVYSVDTSQYVEGTVIQWRVRTAGITLAYGDWSVQRTIDIYAPPTLELEVKDAAGNLIDVLTTFPLYISALAGPKTQRPIGYHLTISANEGYETVDQIGSTKIVNAGEAVYSKYFDTDEPLLVELSAGNLSLNNNVEYTVSCTVSMNSGLTTEMPAVFTVSWADIGYEPDAEIAIDNDIFVAYIKPYCRDADGNAIEDVTLSVYRREFNGDFIELASGLDARKNTVITDPHPALDYARYRIVAVTKSTGTVTCYDPPGYPVGGKAVIIQWDEEWSNFYTAGEDRFERQPWGGSFLKLPYNIDVSDNHQSDVTLVKYIGRTYPVSYYGTQIGTTSNWNVEIDKNDTETLYALRRLARWTSDVYVREPSGSGYWANITVSFSQKHCELTIPVTLGITRVEGGI